MLCKLLMFLYHGIIFKMEGCAWGPISILCRFKCLNGLMQWNVYVVIDLSTLFVLDLPPPPKIIKIYIFSLLIMLMNKANHNPWFLCHTTSVSQPSLPCWPTCRAPCCCRGWWTCPPAAGTSPRGPSRPSRCRSGCGGPSTAACCTWNIGT